MSAAGQVWCCPAVVHQIWWPLAVTVAVTEIRPNRAAVAV
jgi:hypothetical protein